MASNLKVLLIIRNNDEDPTVHFALAIYGFITGLEWYSDSISRSHDMGWGFCDDSLWTGKMEGKSALVSLSPTIIAQNTMVIDPVTFPPNFPLFMFFYHCKMTRLLSLGTTMPPFLNYEL